MEISGLLVSIVSTGAIAVYVPLVYNRLVGLKEEATNGLKGIDVELDRRSKILDNLAAVAKKYLSHEHSVFEEVSALRAKARAAKEQGDVSNQSKHENAISSLFPGIQLAVEAYPELKGDAVVKDLMVEVTNTENRLGFAKSFYNGAAEEFNKRRKTFPAVFVANFFAAFKADLQYWSLPEEDRVRAESHRLEL